MRRWAFALLVIAAVVLPGCASMDKRVVNPVMQLDDPRLEKYSDMYSVDRAAYGLRSLPATGDVTVSCYSDGPLLVFARSRSKRDKTWRFTKGVYFVHRDGKLVWVGESDVYRGPDEFSVGDGMTHVQVSVDFFRESIGDHPEGRSIEYFGDDLRYTKKGLTLEQVEPLIEKWEQTDW